MLVTEVPNHTPPPLPKIDDLRRPLPTVECRLCKADERPTPTTIYLHRIERNLVGRGLPPWLNVVVAVPFGVAFGMLLLFRFAILPAPVMIALVVLMFAPTIYAAIRYYRGTITRIGAPTLVQHGYCGACGYSLEHLQPEHQHVVCPECGSTWNTCRIVRPHWHAASVATTTSHLARPSSMSVDPPRVRRDDRGAYAVIPLGNLANLSAAIRTDAAQLEAVVATKRELRRFRTKAVLVTAPTIAAFGLLIGLIGDRNAAMFTCPFMAIVSAVVVWRVISDRNAINGTPLRHRLVESGRCGQCTHTLLNQPADADGCTTCPRCRAAWLLKAPDHCAYCNFALAGLETPLCPNCGIPWRT